jgi:hypothetical protein
MNTLKNKDNVTQDNKSQSLKQVALFFEKFGQLISAEVPLLRALEIAATSIRDKSLQSSIINIKPKLEGGQSITDSFKEHPEHLSPFILAIIESAEKDGHLDEGFLRAAETLRYEIESSQNPELSILPESMSPESLPHLMGKSVTGAVEQLSIVSKELSVISSRLANVSQQLSHLVKQSKKPKESFHKKGKKNR